MERVNSLSGLAAVMVAKSAGKVSLIQTVIRKGWSFQAATGKFISCFSYPASPRKAITCHHRHQAAKGGQGGENNGPEPAGAGIDHGGIVGGNEVDIAKLDMALGVKISDHFGIEVTYRPDI